MKFSFFPSILAYIYDCFEVQNGHVGFMLSCYDAHLSYGSNTDDFVARFGSTLFFNFCSFPQFFLFFYFKNVLGVFDFECELLKIGSLKV